MNPESGFFFTPPPTLQESMGDVVAPYVIAPDERAVSNGVFSPGASLGESRRKASGSESVLDSASDYGRMIAQRDSSPRGHATSFAIWNPSASLGSSIDMWSGSFLRSTCLPVGNAVAAGSSRLAMLPIR